MTPELTAGVACELDARRGARVRAVHQDGPHRVRLDLRAGPDRFDFVVDLEPRLPRVRLDVGRRAPRKPSALAGALRKHLVGAQLSQAHAVPGERALVLRLEREGCALAFWVELFGGQANWYLLDADERVLWTLRGEVAARREAARGARFVPVPPRPDHDTAPTPDASAQVRALAEASRTSRDEGDATTRLRWFLKTRV
ncbi:MAG: NFACT family protein, partial [Planctomycetota bacterium]|nr:NFACT family protein [Planctomycetota bacterium]